MAIPAVSPAPASTRALPPRLTAGSSDETFEPSAAAFDPATGRVLVLSDHDTTLYRYELGAAGLVLPPGERHEPLRLPEGVQAAKLEGLTRLPSGDFLAVTAFDRPDPRFRRLLRFSYAPDAPAEAVPVAVNDAALSRGGPRRVGAALVQDRGPRRRSHGDEGPLRGPERRQSYKAPRTWCSWCAAPSPTTGSALRRR